MSYWDRRVIDSNDENRKYLESLKKNNVDKVIETVKIWSKNSGLFSIVSDPIKIDLLSLNKRVVDVRCDGGNKFTGKDIKDKVQFFEKKIWKEGFGLSVEKETTIKEIRDPNKHYLWMTFREDGMLVTVGKTNMSNGDLLKYGSVFDLKTGDSRIILEQLLTSFERDILNEISKKMYNYNQFALVLAVKTDGITDGKNYDVFCSKENTNKIDYTGNTDSFVKRLESNLGEFLLENEINILNRNSHRHGG